LAHRYALVASAAAWRAGFFAYRGGCAGAALHATLHGCLSRRSAMVFADEELRPPRLQQRLLLAL